MPRASCTTLPSSSSSRPWRWPLLVCGISPWALLLLPTAQNVSCFLHKSSSSKAGKCQLGGVQSLKCPVSLRLATQCSLGIGTSAGGRGHVKNADLGPSWVVERPVKAEKGVLKPAGTPDSCLVFQGGALGSNALCVNCSCKAGNCKDVGETHTHTHTHTRWAHSQKCQRPAPSWTLGPSRMTAVPWRSLVGETGVSCEKACNETKPQPKGGPPCRDSGEARPPWTCRSRVSQDAQESCRLRGGRCGGGRNLRQKR